MTFIDALEKIAPLSAACQRELRAVVKQEDIRKKRNLVVPGQISDKLYYVETGLVRIFYDTDTDTDTDTEVSREVTSWFGREGGLVLSAESFLLQQPSLETVEVVEVCQLWSIKHADLELMLAKCPELNFHFRIIYQNHLIAEKKRTRLLDLKSPRERYALFLKLFPGLAHRLQVNHIAQFLNISSGALTRARNELKNKH